MNYKEYSYCHVEGNTDIGCRRKANEDWYDSFVCDNGLVAVVCDGMGGNVGGQVASHLAVDSIRRLLTSTYFDSPKTAIVAACNAANQAILHRSTTQPELHGMGSTCAMIIIKGGKVYVGSVGDSRVYMVRNGAIRQLTKDQSYVQTLVDAGQITMEEAENHPRKNEIVNALGLPTMRPATVLSPITPDEEDSFLICSDGLSNMVDDAEIARVINSKARLTQGERVQLLINKARQNGGRDNITCQIIEFSSTVHEHKKKLLPDFSSLTTILLTILGVVLLGTGVYAAWTNFDRDMFKFERKPEKVVAEVPKKQEATVQIVDTVFHDTTGRYIFEIEENRQFQALAIYALNQHGDIDTLTILKPLTLASLKIVPAGSVNVEREGMRSYISFKRKGFKGSTITLSFKDKDEKDYVYSYAVVLNAVDYDPASESDSIDKDSKLISDDEAKDKKKADDDDKDKKKKRKSEADDKEKTKKRKSESDDSKRRKSEKSSDSKRKSKSSESSKSSGSSSSEKPEENSEAVTSSGDSGNGGESSAAPSSSSSSKSSSSSSSSKKKSSSSSSSSKSKSSSSSSSSSKKKSSSSSSSSKSKSGSSSSSSKSKSGSSSSSSKSKSSSSSSKSKSSSSSSKSKSSSSSSKSKSSSSSSKSKSSSSSSKSKSSSSSSKSKSGSSSSSKSKSGSSSSSKSKSSSSSSKSKSGSSSSSKSKSSSSSSKSKSGSSSSSKSKSSSSKSSSSSKK